VIDLRHYGFKVEARSPQAEVDAYCIDSSVDFERFFKKAKIRIVRFHDRHEHDNLDLTIKLGPAEVAVFTVEDQSQTTFRALVKGSYVTVFMKKFPTGAMLKFQDLEDIFKTIESNVKAMGRSSDKQTLKLDKAEYVIVHDEDYIGLTLKDPKFNAFIVRLVVDGSEISITTRKLKKAQSTPLQTNLQLWELIVDLFQHKEHSVVWLKAMQIVREQSVTARAPQLEPYAVNLEDAKSIAGFLALKHMDTTVEMKASFPSRFNVTSKSGQDVVCTIMRKGDSAVAVTGSYAKYPGIVLALAVLNHGCILADDLESLIEDTGRQCPDLVSLTRRGMSVGSSIVKVSLGKTRPPYITLHDFPNGMAVRLGPSSRIVEIELSIDPRIVGPDVLSNMPSISFSVQDYPSCMSIVRELQSEGKDSRIFKNLVKHLRRNNKIKQAEDLLNM
jgi:hypothetical protein